MILTPTTHSTSEFENPNISRAPRAFVAALVAAVVAIAFLPGVSATIASTPVNLPGSTADYVVRGADTSSVLGAVLDAGGQVTRRLDIIGGVAARLAPEAYRTLNEKSIFSITPDSVLTASEDSTASSTPVATGTLPAIQSSIGANELWKDNATGQGVGVALIDTGVVPVPGLDTPGKVLNGPDFSYETDAPELAGLDTAGHGTHMASIIAGRDATASPKKSGSGFMGIAPDATIVNLKVATADGTTTVSTVIEALGWIVANPTYSGTRIRVLNLAFSADPSIPYGLDPLAFAVEQVWFSGVAVVAAAGNSGASTTSLTNSAYDPYVIAVGASDPVGTLTATDDVVASFSSSGSATRFPDVLAPGISVEGLRNPGSFIDWLYPEGRVGDRFFRGSGTSQSTAVVSGAVALLFSKFPSLTPDGAKYAIKTGALKIANAPEIRGGSGVIRLDRSMNPAGKASKSPAEYAQTWPVSAPVFVPVTSEGSTVGGSTRAVDPYAGSPFVARRWTSAGWTGDIAEIDYWLARRWTGESWDGRRWTDAGWTAGAWASAFWGEDAAPEALTAP